MTALLLSSVSGALLGCAMLVTVGAAVQVAVGAGLSVVCGPVMLLWLGPAVGVPVLLCLNLIVSAVATAFGPGGVRWDDAVLASLATLAGCVVASALPALPEGLLKGLTAAVLVLVALPRPPVPGAAPSAASVRGGIGLAGLLTGLLTVWTATPGPITPMALARGGRSGSEIRRTMQPIGVVGYGAALAWVGLPSHGGLEPGAFAWLIGATLLGTGVGFDLRRRIGPARVVLVVRIVAAAAAALLILSLFR